MGSLFQGTPQMAFSASSSNTQTPDWMQKAIYDQIQWATNVANTPYTPYAAPTVAPLTELQNKSQELVKGNVGQWQPSYEAALTGTQNLAGTNSVANVGQYMNPYQQNVMDVMARQGVRNLQENIMPALSDQFIRAGQFGSKGMGEFGARAVRDLNESLMNQQAQLAASGYTQALNASKADLERQQSALQQVGAMSQQGQALRTADAAALESAGAAQQGQEQKVLDAARQQFEAQRLYPQQQLDWLNTQIRGMAPITPQTTTASGTQTGGSYSASPLSQLAAGLSLYKGLTSK